MTGTVIRIIGAVLDIAFPVDAIPPIHNLVYVLDDQHGRKVPCEVVQHLPGAVRCVSLEATEGLSRGLLVEDTGAVAAAVGTRCPPRRLPRRLPAR